MVILGPKNLPYVKLFLRQNPQDVCDSYAFYNHCEVVPHFVIWLSCKATGQEVLKAVHEALLKSYKMAENNHIEMNYDSFEMEIILDQVFRDHGITWSMSDDDREKLLDQEAQKQYDNALKRKRAEMGVVVDR